MAVFDVYSRIDKNPLVWGTVFYLLGIALLLFQLFGSTAGSAAVFSKNATGSLVFGFLIGYFAQKQKNQNFYSSSAFSFFIATVVTIFLF